MLPPCETSLQPSLSLLFYIAGTRPYRLPCDTLPYHKMSPPSPPRIRGTTMTTKSVTCFSDFIHSFLINHHWPPLSDLTHRLPLSFHVRGNDNSMYLIAQHLLGTTAFSLIWISTIKSFTAWGGRAQNTRQCLQSLNPGSMVGSSRRFSIVSTTTPSKSADSSFSFCWDVRAVL